MAGRVRAVMVFGLAAIACDALVAVAAWTQWRSFDAAPKSMSLAPGDDPNFAVSGFAYALCSLLRYVVLAGLVVALLRRRSGEAQRDGAETVAADLRLRLPIAGALVAIEVLYVALAWPQPDPDGAWCVTRVSSILISAILSVLVVSTFRKRPGLVTNTA